MNLINYLPKIKIIIGIIVIILLIATYGYLFPKEFIFSCSGTTEVAKWTDEKEPTLINRENRNEFGNIVKVKKYFQGYFYTINNYSILQCSKYTDWIFCNGNTPWSEESANFDLLKVKYESSEIQKIIPNLVEIKFFSRKCELKENIFK